MASCVRDFVGLPHYFLMLPLLGLVAESVDGSSFAAAAVAVGVCGAEVGGVVGELGVCAAWVVVVELEGIGGLWRGGVVDGLSA